MRYAFQKKEKREGMTTSNVIIASGIFEFQTCQKKKKKIAAVLYPEVDLSH
jgi:hypothetical protein